MVRLSEHMVTGSCPECGSTSLELDHQRGELLCIDCGMVLMEKGIDLGPDWTTGKDGTKDPSRAGPARKAWSPEGVQSTDIGWKDVDSYGASIPLKNRGQIYRLRKWQRRLRHQRTSQKNLIRGFYEIERTSNSLDLPPKVIEDARTLFKKASDLNLIQGRGIECMVAASIYTACRDFNVPRTLNEISEKSGISRKEIGRAFRKLAKDLELGLKVTTPSDYIHRFCSKLQLDDETLRCCLDVIRKAEESGYISGKDPVGIAASAIYIASLMTGQTRTQEEISWASGITEVTIRKRYKEIIKRLGLKVTNGYRSASF